MSPLGTKIVLWKEEYSPNAYVDQMGVSQLGYIVYDEFLVTIVEVKQVRGRWGNSFYEGWKAVTENGDEFTCNWEIFPDDSMTPTYYWDARNDNGVLWRPVDAIQAHNFFPHVDIYGNKKLPMMSKVCEKHSDALHLESDVCWKCVVGT